NPLAITGYRLCAYDSSGGVPGLVLTARIGPGGTCNGKPCWKQTKTGFKYSSKTDGPDGIQALTLTGGGPGKAKIMCKGKGAHLPTPALPFAQDPAVIVQIVSTDGVCWDARYSTSKKNEGGQFKAKSD